MYKSCVEVYGARKQHNIKKQQHTVDIKTQLTVYV